MAKAKKQKKKEEFRDEQEVDRANILRWPRWARLL
jgi:hypothetical protein